ncbi:uncharacterized protein BXIN_0275 [Babesia sp. Xinjiang]|uniref:uncharacterized protein n=1 Tax=Babesia sp. Xinjiang TaxID=462227 RepID=UPI000A231CA6|nr:uncharacterized protein BXIN_0275 [Babesia sp. Xinjiang]ORM39682.1 hypothetical protein BXIN_0275 [Babesia sp. Xinjiang]
MSNKQHDSLTEHPPGNLKECIDWLLRLTEKDGQNGGGGQNGNGSTELGKKVVDLLKKVDDATEKLENDQKVLKAVTKNGNGTNLITTLADNLAKFIGYNGGNGDLDGKGIGKNNGGTKYTSSYNGNEAKCKWSEAMKLDNDHNTCASIFLGTLPVIFSGLSYLYWQCNKGTGGRGDRWCKGTYKIHETNPLGIYFIACGYDPTKLNDKQAGDAVKTLLGETCFKEEFKNNGAKVDGPYPVYIKEVLDKTNYSNTTDHPLSSLYIASQYYFTYKQTLQKECNRQPTTIREMLYWLMALPYSGCFQYAEQEIKNGIKKHGSGIIPFEGGPTLKPTDPLDCLISTTCHYAAVVLSTIQGKLCTPKDTKTDETTKPNPPNIHSIYSNSHFKFSYPTTVIDWFNKLWDIVYALITQLFFLKEQCITCLYGGCGWKYCKYGNGIKYENVKSWICTAPPGTQGTPSQSPHDCATAKCATAHIQACGKDKPSPLQAFLTDCLTGFQCESLKNKKCQIQNGQLVSTNGGDLVSYSSHVSHRQFRLYCPVPMGFNKDCLSHTERTGDCICWILHYFTQKDRNYVTLYNTIICLICTGLRTPRTAGDLFWFFYTLGQYYDTNNGGTGSETLKSSIESQIETYLWAAIANKPDKNEIGTRLKSLGGSSSSHNGSTSHADLFSLNGCWNTPPCAGYLDPISRRMYSIYIATSAKTYISYIVYLTKALKDYLQQLLDEFKKVSCTHCNKECTNKPKCHQDPSKCSCTNVVQCAGVLGVLYKFGFTYSSASGLNGQYKSKREWLRKCSQFSDQLQNVITGEPFNDLLSVINVFLYHIRKPFLYYLLTFWLLAITYLTYSLTIPLDVLHLRSHLRTAAVSPLVLLTNYAQQHDITYFKP